MPATDYKTQLGELREQLRNPLRLRIAVTGLVLLVGYAAIYVPISDNIDQQTRQLSQERQRETLAQDVEFLRSQVAMFEQRLQPGSDPNQWVQYLLDGIRAVPLHLINLDLDVERRVGPYRAIVMRLEVGGDVAQLDTLLHWLETNDRLFRIDTMKMEPARGQQKQRVMQLTLLGLKA